MMKETGVPDPSFQFLVIRLFDVIIFPWRFVLLPVQPPGLLPKSRQDVPHISEQPEDDPKGDADKDQLNHLRNQQVLIIIKAQISLR